VLKYARIKGGLHIAKNTQPRRRRANVRALERGLELLELVNDEGGIKPADAGRKLRLPRPTAHRLLETLEELGYVRRSVSDNRFLVTHRTCRLSGGYDADIQIREAAGPILSRLLQELVWPTNIASYRGGIMVVRETTHQRSHLSVDRAMIGREVPMLRTACGRAYLAFCQPAERREIIDSLQTQNDPADHPYLIPEAVEKMVSLARRNGFAVRHNEPYVRNTSSVAVPIVVDGEIQACLSIIWLTAAMSLTRAVKAFVPGLRTAAHDIATAVAHAQH
jgi:IclR family transcriptional regulator, mhp operon transcriptional activator